jgi:hypothetical protein
MQVSSGLGHKYFLGTFVNYDHKKFYNIGPGDNVKKILHP